MKNEVANIIHRVLLQFASKDQASLEIEASLDTELYGGSSLLDSLGLVTLIVAVEQEIEDRFEMEISLDNEKAMSQKRSPFRTVGSLTDYIVMLLEEQAND